MTEDGINYDEITPQNTYAIAAAVLFGASTPAAKWLSDGTSPWLLAGLLYLGSGLGLLLIRTLQRRFRPENSEAAIRGRNWIWLLGATFCGGVLAPVLLMMGLSLSDAASTSLLLNLEGIFTAMLAWFAFRENFDKRIMLGMVAIVAGSVLLSWTGYSAGNSIAGPLFVVAACVFWAIDNNLTKKISGGDALQIAMTKGLVAGVINTCIALGIAHFNLAAKQVCLIGLVGFFGYGVSLLLFVLALRNIGAARTAAYFSLAPFVGAVIALVVGEAAISWQLMGAVALMSIGVWLHLSEKHDHEHIHGEVEHEHTHVHDEHHMHAHNSESVVEPHSHRHQHAPLVHSHPHFPDLHHMHTH